MTKIFIIYKNRVHQELKGYKNLADAKAHFAPNIEIVEAPDRVFLDWGCVTVDGKVSFTQPTAPEGWEYDANTGTFWNPEQNRATEREALYVEAEKQISKCQEKIATDDTDGEWATYLQALYQYKADVRDTKSQAGYPNVVEYPDMPQSP